MYVVGDGLVMFLDNFHCSLGGIIVAMMFLMLVSSSVGFVFFVIVWTWIMP